MNRKYFFIIVVGAAIIAALIAAYFYFSKKKLDLPTENLAIQQTIKDERPATATTTSSQNEAVSIKDRTLKKDGFTLLVPAGWAEVEYMAGATIVANPGEENLDPAFKESDFKSYFSVTREKMGEKTWEQAVAYVRIIVNGAAPDIKYVSERDGVLAGDPTHYWEADLARDSLKFKVLVYAVRGKSDDLWILTFNTAADMWPAYSRLAPKVFDSFRLI